MRVFTLLVHAQDQHSARAFVHARDADAVAIAIVVAVGVVVVVVVDVMETTCFNVRFYQRLRDCIYDVRVIQIYAAVSLSRSPDGRGRRRRSAD